jgi:N-glycosylase/DNA lyase
MMEQKTADTPDIGISPPGFDPDATFLCGQCFRWSRDEQGHWHGITGNHPVRLVPQTADTWRIVGASNDDIRRVWLPYLDWQAPYRTWQETLADGDPVMAAAIAFAPGLRLLRQDPWETLATFLISQNNGIPRIRSIVDTLCTCFGEPLGDTFTFPSVETLAALSEETLSVCRAGYRTRYLIRAARQLAGGEVDLAALPGMPHAEARDALLRLFGVGIKVADCALLFSGSHREAFPVDRWVIRVMNALYPAAGKDPAAIRQYAADRWGALAGLAQEYLFHYARMHSVGL